MRTAYRLLPIVPAAIRAAIAVPLFSIAVPAHAGLGTAVEFYNKALNHYFVTAYPEEAAALDAGTNVKGWTRTGGQFTVFTEPAEGLQAVCRFFGTPNVGPNSHFYTADAAECAKVKTYPAWTFEGIAFYIPTTSNGDCGSNWPVYRSYYSDQIRDANHRFTVDLTAHVRMAKRRGDILEGIVMCAPVTDEEREADVVRFLEQATLGPTEALVQEVKAKGIAAYIDEQLPLNVTRYTQLPYFENPVDAATCTDDTTGALTPEKFCFTFKASSRPVGWEFFRQARAAPDQLRVRMAHNWHEILLAENFMTYAHADFQQRIRDHALGTFENLLLRYTLSPQLGKYQNWVFNKPEQNGIKPNENYARELLQLFTIGVSELNEDGTLVLDAKGQPVPTYAQADVETHARILTGYVYPPLPPDVKPVKFFEYFIGDMVPVESQHDKGAKTALNGRLTFAAGGNAKAEVEGLLRILVNHPNTPPFIVRQMIQKTVTSSPTPGYVARMVAVFKNNGKGVRGDLAAVTRAILLDPEARGARKIDPEYGRLRPPALFWTALIRGLDITTDGAVPYERGWNSGQSLFSPPSVFGYYPADFTLAGGAIPAPEFGIFGTSETLNRANQVVDILFNGEQPWANDPVYGWQPRTWIPGATGTRPPSLAAYLPYAGDAEALVARIDRFFLHGTMKADIRRTIVNAVNKIAATDATQRVRMALLLTLASMDYLVQK
ncbi:MAG: DUF1800 family protein [Burkholderiales bacterium]